MTRLIGYFALLTLLAAGLGNAFECDLALRVVGKSRDTREKFAAQKMSPGFLKEFRAAGAQSHLEGVLYVAPVEHLFDLLKDFKLEMTEVLSPGIEGTLPAVVQFKGSRADLREALCDVRFFRAVLAQRPGADEAVKNAFLVFYKQIPKLENEISKLRAEYFEMGQEVYRSRRNATRVQELVEEMEAMHEELSHLIREHKRLVAALAWKPLFSDVAAPQYFLKMPPPR